MDPKTADTPEGFVRYAILREIFRAIVIQGSWVHTASNWALGSTGAYLGLLVANLDKIQPHLEKDWQWPVFGFALASTVVGIGIQIAYGIIRFAIAVEEQIFSFVVQCLTNPEKLGVKLVPGDTANQFAKRTMSAVLKEFIECRPWAFGELAEASIKKGEEDILYMLKPAAACAQMTFVFMIVQYVLLGFAIFLPFSQIR